MTTREPVALERSDLEPLPETRVAVDNLLEFGFAPQAHFPTVEMPLVPLGNYEMRDLDGGISFPLEVFPVSRIGWPCPLLGCEDFQGQSLVPRCVRRVGASDLTFHNGFTYLGADIASGTDESAAVALAAAINATPPKMTIHLGNGATLVVDEHNFNLGDVVTINGQRFRVGDIIRDPTAVRAAASPPRVELLAMTGAQMTERTAKQHLENARPRRRLDGRRAG